MALPQRYLARDYISPEAYLEMDRRSEVRLEYVDGEVRAMAGEDPNHNQISLNISSLMNLAFLERPCYVYMEGVRVQVRGTHYRYPDVAALCGEAKYADTKPRTLLNPQVLIEVLSDSTSEIDLTEKLDEYTQLASVTDYLIVAQTKMWVLHYTRSNGKMQRFATYKDPEAEIRLEALDFAISLADTYRKVVFPVPDLEEKSEES